MFKNKNAQSNLIVIVLVIVVTLVAVILAWNILNPLFKEKSKDINLNAVKNEFEIKSASLSVTGAFRVDVQRKSGNLTIDSLKFVFEEESGKNHIEIENGSIPLVLETSSYFFSPIKDFGKIKKITIYPVINGREGIGSSIDSGNIFNIPAGLVSWWKFDNNLEDSIGKNNGIIEGNVQYVNNENRKAVNFISGSVNFGNDSSLSLDREFAIALWIRVNSKRAEILRKGDSNFNYFIGINENGKANFSYFSGGIVKSKETQKIIGDGKWHHIIITNLAIYSDGNLDSILNIGGKLKINDNNLTLGRDFDGYISDLMIFNKSLDKVQASSVFNSFK